SSRQQGWRGAKPSASMAQNASALANDSDSRPRERSSQASASRTPASSSTMKTVALAAGCMGSGGLRGLGLRAIGGRIRGEREAENRTLRRQGLEPEKSPMLFHHGAAQAQAQPHALGLGGEEGREQPLLHLLG